MRLIGLTILALIAFAANSVLARLALSGDVIAPGSFTLIRIVSGACVLALLLQRRAFNSGSWAGGLALLSYAGFFSWAYLSLGAGTGALILFAAVQVTMIGAGLLMGERLGVVQWLGFFMAIAGLVFLLAPGLSAPPIIGAGLMAVSGISWGLYSLIGRGRQNPSAQTAGNFIRAAVMAIALSLPLFWLWPEPLPTAKGIVLALTSGIITSGFGYILWYAALKSLRASQAGIAQLMVPPLAALGGVLFLSETISLRFLLASTIILIGVVLATRQKDMP